MVSGSRACLTFILSDHPHRPSRHFDGALRGAYRWLMRMVDVALSLRKEGLALAGTAGWSNRPYQEESGSCSRWWAADPARFHLSATTSLMSFVHVDQDGSPLPGPATWRLGRPGPGTGARPASWRPTSLTTTLTTTADYWASE